MSSYNLPTLARSESEIRQQIAERLAPHTQSRQATGNVHAHSDGENVHKDFEFKVEDDDGVVRTRSAPPFHRYLHRQERKDNPIANYPGAFVDAIFHVNDREIEIIERLDVDYDPDPYRPTHEYLRKNFDPLRGRMMEWFASDSRRYRKLSDGGTDIHLYGPPGRGKSTCALWATWLMMEVNNETILWAESLEEGTNERTEWVPMAPYATIALPAGVPVDVRIVPKDPSVPPFQAELSDICRDVVRYETPIGLVEQLEAGQFYVVYPDPLLRGCKEVSSHPFVTPDDVAREPGKRPKEPTDANHWWFAFIAARISYDKFLHPTTINIDEAGNLIDPDAEKGPHGHYDKVVWLMKKYADARKKNLSFLFQTHALAELHEKVRRKQRWWITMNGVSPPTNATLPGGKKCGVPYDYVSSMAKGEAAAWNTNEDAWIRWPNLKRARSIDAEISIDFPTWDRIRGVA